MNYILRRKWVGNPTTIKIAQASQHLSVHSTNDGDPPDPEGGFIFRWGTTSNIPQNGEVVNSAKAIHRVFDKSASRKRLFSMGLAPKCWTDIEEFLEYCSTLESEPPKVVIRPKNHIRGQDIIFGSSILETYKASKKFSDGFYISEIIDKKKEFRVFTLSGRILGMVQKMPDDPTEFAWGCADEEGGSFKYIPWSKWDLDLAEKCVLAANEFKIDFSAIDIVQDAGGKNFILELNSAPSLSTYWCEVFALGFDYVVEHGREIISVHPDKDWKSYIHPSLSTGVKVA